MKKLNRPLLWVLILIIAIIVFLMAKSLSNKGIMNNEGAPQQQPL